MSKTVTFTNPLQAYAGSGGTSATVPIMSYEIHQSFGEISTCTVRIETNVASLYNLDSSTSNPLQLNSQMVLQDGSDYWFRGVVTEKPYYEDAQGADNSVLRYMVVECRGKESALVTAAITDSSGNERWDIATSTYEVGSSAPYLPLQVSSQYGSFDSDTDTLWPDPSDATGAKCYLQDSDCANDTINADILIGTAAPFYLELTTSNEGLAPQGWLKINSEWFYYEGYDPTGGGGRYRVYVLERAALGTSAAGHTAGDTAYNKIGKRIGPEPLIVYEDTAGGTAFIAMAYGDRYSTHYSYGCFIMAGGVVAGASYAATCYYYDEDKSLDAGSTVIALPDVIKAIVTTPLAYGGSGFTAADLGDEFDNVTPSAEYTAMAAETGITRYDYTPKTKPQTQWQAVRDLIEALNLTDEYEFIYNHSTNKLRLLKIANGTVDHTLTGVESVEQEQSMDDVYSAIRVEYTLDQDPNLANPNYAWHEGCAGAGAKPDTWYRCTAEAESYSRGTFTTSTAAGGSNFGVDMTVDGKLDTKLMAEILHDPGGEFPHTIYWFGSDHPLIDIDEISVWVNVYRSTDKRSRTNTDKTFVVRIDGCVDFDSATHTGTWQNLGDKFSGKASGDAGRTAQSKEFTLTTMSLPQVNAIRVVWEYMPGPVSSGHKYWAVIHMIRIHGNQTRYVFVQTTDDTDNRTNPAYLYDPDAHVKLRGGVNADSSAGAQRVGFINIGASSEAAAYTIGRAALQDSLILYKSHSYSYPGVLSAKPELGDTVATNEDGVSVDYTGVLREFSISGDGVANAFDYTVLDYAADVIS